MKPTSKGGRPPKPPDQVKTKIFQTRCTPEQKLKYEQLKKEIELENEPGVNVYKNETGDYQQASTDTFLLLSERNTMF